MSSGTSYFCFSPNQFSGEISTDLLEGLDSENTAHLYRTVHPFTRSFKGIGGTQKTQKGNLKYLTAMLGRGNNDLLR